MLMGAIIMIMGAVVMIMEAVVGLLHGENYLLSEGKYCPRLSPKNFKVQYYKHAVVVPIEVNHVCTHGQHPYFDTTLQR